MTASRPIVAVLAMMVMAGAAWAEDFRPVSPQPNTTTLNDGLAVRYYYAKYNHIDELIDWMSYEDGEVGDPLPDLNYDVGPGNVLTTTSSDLVGAEITGLIRFEQAGTYNLRVTSNDGVRLWVGGVQVFEDPGVHRDSTSDPLPIAVAEPGWYPLKILYYEKKGTSTLRLEWQSPGGGFAVVPASHLKHQ